MEFWLSRSLSHEPFSFFTMEFWLSGSLSDELFLFRDGILAIRKPFTNFSFTWWNLGYHEAFSRNFSFAWWNIGYHGAFSRNFSFTWWNLGYHGAFSRNFLSHDGILKKDARCGGRLFSYISQRVFT
jgi:hypothetical protein